VKLVYALLIAAVSLVLSEIATAPDGASVTPVDGNETCGKLGSGV